MDAHETVTEKSARVQREAIAVALIARLALERPTLDGLEAAVDERVTRPA